MSEAVQRIADRLRRELEAQHVEVEDESRLHAGHAGARESGGGHFRVRIVSARFEGLSRLRAQRLVYQALAEQMSGGEIHALGLATFTPEQWARKGGS